MKLEIATILCFALSIGLTYGNSVSLSYADDHSTVDSGDNNVAEDYEPPSRYRSIVTAKITAYCLRGITRSGTYTTYGTVATDRRYIPQYSRMHIEGLNGTYTSLDTGSAVIGFHVDVWMDNCYSARQWGVRYREVYILRD